MGKYKKSKKKERRPQPTGLPTVQEAENELTLEPPSPASSPLLDKVKVDCETWGGLCRDSYKHALLY